MIVWNGRRAGAMRLGWPSSSVKPAPRLCRAIPVSPTSTPAPKPSKIDWIHDTALRSPSTAHR